VTSRISILGAGGHAKVVIEAAALAGWDSIDVFDDAPEKWGTSILGFTVRGPIDECFHRPAERKIHCAIGSNRARYEISQKYRIQWETIRHPAAILSSSAVIGAGAFIGALVIVQSGARIGDQVILNTGAIIEHDVDVLHHAHIAPGSILGGNVSVGEGCLIGLGARILPGTRVGAWAQIGAGSVVVEEVPPQTTVAGVPARQLRQGPAG